jgi:molybdopterin adenylyltransferase
VPSNSAAEHRTLASERGPIALAIVTVSDTRTEETDVNGQYLREKISALGHRVVAYHLIKDEPDQVEKVLESCAAGDAQVVLFNGGTGISSRDRTFDVLDRKLEKPLPGFGEIFRMLSYDQVGAAAMISRATAGVYHDTVVISTPGSPAAVKLAWEKLIASELSHLAWELVR